MLYCSSQLSTCPQPPLQEVLQSVEETTKPYMGWALHGHLSEAQISR